MFVAAARYRLGLHSLIKLLGGGQGIGINAYTSGDFPFRDSLIS